MFSIEAEDKLVLSYSEMRSLALSRIDLNIFRRLNLPGVTFEDPCVGRREV